MKPPRTITSAPSPALLRFLRAQSDIFGSQQPCHHQSFVPAFGQTQTQTQTQMQRNRHSHTLAKISCSRWAPPHVSENAHGNANGTAVSIAASAAQPPLRFDFNANLSTSTTTCNSRLARASMTHPSALNPTVRPCPFSSSISSTSFAAATHSSPSSYSRPLSTSTSTRFWGLLKRQRGEAASGKRRDTLPPLASFLDDNGSLGRVVRPTNELKLRCTEFDDLGNVTLVNGEFKKSELIAKYGLLPRDLRKIDSSLLPHILVRPSAILLNLLHLRVLIKHNRVLVFDAYGTTDSFTQSVFMYDLEGKLRQKDSPQNGALPYEFRALEAVLMSVTLGLESEFEGVSEPVVRVLRELEEDIDREKLRYLLIYSKKLGTFEQKARLVRDALDELLEADDDLSSMYLTEKAHGRKRDEDNDHTEVEMLLESYHKFADEIVQAAENLVSNIRNTEEIVKAILDANRNSLMLLDIRFSIFTLSLGCGTFVAALYGMNLKNFIEESDLGFIGVSAWCTLLGVVTAAWGIQKLRKIQRVSMWGEHGRRLMRGWGPMGGPPGGGGGCGPSGALPFPGGAAAAAAEGNGVGTSATGSGLGPGTSAAGMGMLPAGLGLSSANAAAAAAAADKQSLMAGAKYRRSGSASTTSALRRRLESS